ncbi:hypothetical protein JD523_09330 [Aeromonas enteropelogenes]|uniref:hypothetical protein n=1 Tax=Aeromonas enteropelogenes TaxID=29489 RepID=UPI00191E5F10|nr:hypothetical protein [Aeromonas enteropelogenes]MBL0521105.1 hypothetical protein [Aeromonas enteropelogenes]
MKHSAAFTQYAVQKEFTIQEAAHLLCGILPGSQLDSDKFCSVQTVTFSICESIESGHLFASSFKSPKHGWWEAEGIISNSELGKWAKVRNFCWPPVGGASDYQWFLNVIASIKPARQMSNQQEPHNFDKQKFIDLENHAAELAKQLSKAEAEISALKLKTTTFRHITPLLELVAAVQERYWGDNWDRNDPDTTTKQDDIIEWIMSDPRCSSKKRAEVVAIAARPLV